MITRDSDLLNTFYLTQFDAVIEVISSWPDFAKYTEKFKSLRSDFMERGRKVFDPLPTHFNTLIHGDMWINNLMTKYPNATEVNGNADDRTPENIIFLDFQYSCWTSPAIDLHYFLNTSLVETLRLHHIKDLIEFYHKHLSAFLKQLNYQRHIPTLQQFHDQFMEKSFYGECSLLFFHIHLSQVRQIKFY